MDIMIEKATLLQTLYFNRAKTKLFYFTNDTKKFYFIEWPSLMLAGKVRSRIMTTITVMTDNDGIPTVLFTL